VWLQQICRWGQRKSIISFSYWNHCKCDENLYVADLNNYQTRKITKEGVVSTIAGNSKPGNKDGKGTLATFQQPIGIV